MLARILEFLLLILLLVLCNCAQDNLPVRVYIDTNSHDPVRMISFCLDCDSPDSGGSLVYGLVPKFAQFSSPSNNNIRYQEKIIGELLYCVPNYAEQDAILNKHLFGGRVVFVDRGRVSLLEKAKKIQKAGALAIIIGDDGQCLEDFSYCGVRAGSKQEGGFSSNDDPIEWKKLSIPIVMISKLSSIRLKKLMTLKEFNIPGVGRHNITIIGSDDSEL